MTEPETRFGWNWMAIWWYFVLSLCGATIGAYTLVPHVLNELAKTNDAQVQKTLPELRATFELTTNIASFAAIAAIVISSFLIPKFYGPVRKN